MIYDFICGIPVGDILAIIYYIKRTYFQHDPYYIYSPKFHSLIEDLVEAKGIPQPAAGILVQELICTPQTADMEAFIDQSLPFEQVNEKIIK